MESSKPRVLVSRCLLGERVRYDGREKGLVGLRAALSRWAEVVPVCPEVEAGMSVPRPPVNLHRGRGGLVVMRSVEGEDWTGRLLAARDARLSTLGAIDGVLLKSKSPSCGLREIPRWSHGVGAGHPSGGPGLFAVAARGRTSGPVCSERELQSAVAVSGFLARLTLARAWREAEEGSLFVQRWSLTLGALRRGTWRALRDEGRASARPKARVGELVSRALRSPQTLVGHRWALRQALVLLRGRVADEVREDLRGRQARWLGGQTPLRVLLAAHLDVCPEDDDANAALRAYLKLHLDAAQCVHGSSNHGP